MHLRTHQNVPLQPRNNVQLDTPRDWHYCCRTDSGAGRFIMADQQHVPAGQQVFLILIAGQHMCCGLLLLISSNF